MKPRTASVSSKLSEEGKTLLDFLTSKFDEIKDEFGEMIRECKNMVSKVQRESQDLGERLASLHHDMMIDIKKKDDKIGHLQKEVDFLRSRVTRLEERVEDEDAYERRDCLVFSGEAVPIVETGENCNNKISTLLKTINVSISNQDISTAHRLGKRPVRQETDKRPIIVKFCRRDIKMDILRACKSQRPKFFVNESLTPTRSSILWALRRMKRTHSNIISGCNSENGRVCAWIRKQGGDQRDIKKYINTYEQIKHFSETVIGEPIEKYIESWQH